MKDNYNSTNNTNQVISEWKTNTKKKSREINKCLNNNVECKLYLRNTEERLIKLLQKINSEHISEDTKNDENITSNFSLSELCEVSQKKNQITLKKTLQKNEFLKKIFFQVSLSEETSANNSLNDITKSNDLKIKCEETFTHKINSKIAKKIPLNRQKMRRRLALQRTLELHSENMQSLAASNENLTESVKVLSNSFQTVAKSIDSLVKILHKLSET